MCISATSYAKLWIFTPTNISLSLYGASPGLLQQLSFLLLSIAIHFQGRLEDSPSCSAIYSSMDFMRCNVR